MAAYLPPGLAWRARSHATATGRSLSSLIVEAVSAYFERLDFIEAIDHDMLLQRYAVVPVEIVEELEATLMEFRVAVEVFGKPGDLI